MKRLALFPDGTTIEQDTLTIAGQDFASLANEHGTPLYLYDSVTMDNAVSAYKTALASFYAGPVSSPKAISPRQARGPDGGASLTYAGKAYLCTAIAQWAQHHDLWLDCTGEGEIAIARAGEVLSEHILVHGVNKVDADLKSALEYAGTVVIDNPSELHRFFALWGSETPREPIQIWLRLQPGLAVSTHAYTQTGQHDSKFGMDGEELLEAAFFCRKYGLPLRGLHFHQGSQFRDPAPLRPAIALALDLAKQIGFSGDWHFSPGGGWGVAYHEDDLPHPEIASYVKLIAETVIETCRQLGLDLPHLHIEPGRSLIARAGVAIYRVNTVKRQGGRTWLLVDGGLADNPRHALYGARYSALTVANPNRERSERVHIGGPYCESGDIMIKDLPMPKVREGELIAVPMSGAYQLSMSSNYNGARRPAVLWLENGEARLIQRRETVEDLLLRDVGLPG
jgi:diaminopimelate decarboxylase